jgi:hypothetical protein
MTFSRRNLLGVLVAGSAGMIMPRSAAPIPSADRHARAWPRAFATIRSADRPVLLTRALAALNSHRASIPHHDMIGLVDFSAPSHSPRLYLVDVASEQVVATMLVAHGRGSDPANSGWAEKFSNRPGSNASSEGSFLTGDIYSGKHGRSRRLHGLDADNSLAESRAIVIHAAAYVDARLAREHGRIGRSEGCFAVSHDDIAPLLARLDTGRLLYASKLV